MIKVAVIASHTIIRKGLESIFSAFKDVEVTAICDSVDYLITSMAEDQPDILFLDMPASGSEGQEMATRVARKYPSTHIVVLFNYDAWGQVKNMLPYCKGFLLKNTDSLTLLNAIKAVYKNELFMQDELQQQLLVSTGPFNRLVDQPSLTPREKEVLSMIAEGYTSVEMAGKLFLSMHTIENHRSNLMKKKKVKNAAELIKVAFEEGLVSTFRLFEK
jgi:DNA-binding NarL/FixJ family response regulator